MKNTHQESLRALLSPTERRLFQKLNTPQKIQHFLDSFPVNFAQTNFSPGGVLKRNKGAQCMEGALLAAAVLAYHGEPPLLLDLRTTDNDDDHVVALFKERGAWGAISKTNHAVLRFRDPIYKTIRELALSYFHEYFLDSGVKTLREYSTPFDLRTYKPGRWVTAKGNLWWLAEELDDSKHFKIMPKGMSTRHLHPASKIERAAGKLVEWKKTSNGVKKQPLK